MQGFLSTKVTSSQNIVGFLILSHAITFHGITWVYEAYEDYGGYQNTKLTIKIIEVQYSRPRRNCS